MALFKCKICGGALEIDSAQSVATCEYCGTKQTLPRLDDERRANLYDRANHFRRNNDFDKAMGIFEQILNEEPTDAEAYWSIVLCRYGIEYVEDPTTRRRVPTVNRAQFTSIFDDEDYKSAIANADGDQRELYEAEANAINELQKSILAISQKEEPFDVFICYKESDASGRRTKDSVLATELYHELTREGFKVFFSRITLEDKLGQEYEPYIFAALNSAKVMVVLGTRPEHFNAVWVKNEWSRYLALIKNGARKALIPAYRDMDPYDLPEEFSHLQAQDMSKLGFMQDLVHGITKMATVQPFTSPAPTKMSAKSIETAAFSNIAPLLERAFLFLEDGEFDRADEFCEQVLNQDPRNVRAYLVKLMIDMGVRKQEDLIACGTRLEENGNYQKALRFAEGEQVEIIKGYALQAKYDFAVEIMQSARGESEFQDAALLFSQMPDYKDASQRQEQCLINAEEARKKTIYQEGIELLGEREYINASKMFERIVGYRDAEEQRKDAIYRAAKTEAQKNTSAGMEKAIKLLTTIPGWRDADAKAEECCKRATVLAKKEKLAKKKGLIIGLSMVGVALITLITVIVYVNTVVYVEKDGIKYEKIDGAYHVVGYEGSASTITISDEIKGKPVTTIGSFAFWRCFSIKRIIIPSSVTIIENSAFAECASLTTITIPPSLTSIGSHAFNGCSSLAKITIPSSVTSIGAGAFYHCTALKGVYITDLAAWCNIKFDDNPLYYADNLFLNGSEIAGDIVIPDGVTAIPDYAFYGCDQIISITIPSNVTSIGEYAFGGCINLSSAIFGDTIGWNVRKQITSSSSTTYSVSYSILEDPALAANCLISSFADYFWTTSYATN